MADKKDYAAAGVGAGLGAAGLGMFGWRMAKKHPAKTLTALASARHPIGMGKIPLKTRLAAADLALLLKGPRFSAALPSRVGVLGAGVGGVLGGLGAYGLNKALRKEK